MADFENCVIFLNGFPATGKLTIAREICHQSNFILYDNHTVNNALFSLFTQKQKDNLPNNRLSSERQKIYDVVYDTFINHVPPENSYVFTGGCMAGKDKTKQAYNEFKELHTIKRNTTFLPVNLTCSTDELLKRVINPERAKHHKLIDSDILKDILSKETLMSLDHPNAMTLDVTSTSPSESASTILNHLASLK